MSWDSAKGFVWGIMFCGFAIGIFVGLVTHGPLGWLILAVFPIACHYASCRGGDNEQ